jgi:NAD(P)-dependent dehydrogenase (short-subunit alcohol dehydrogenase family)
MQARGGGAIVNIASIAGMSGYGGSVASGPSKAAMIALTRDIAAMHGRDGIRANAVAPGHVYTPHIGHMFSDEIRTARRRVGPLGVEGDAWTLPRPCCFW